MRKGRCADDNSLFRSKFNFNLDVEVNFKGLTRLWKISLANLKIILRILIRTNGANH